MNIILSKWKFSFLCLILLGLLNVNSASGQRFNTKYRYISFGPSINFMNYVGDLDPGPSIISPGLKFTRYNFGGQLNYRYTPVLSFRGSLSWGRIAGDDFKNSTYSLGKKGDIWRKYRNLSFFNNIIEVKADAVFDLIGHRGKYTKRPDFVPYVFIGLVYFHHNPKARLNGEVYHLRDYSTEGQGLIDGAPKKYSLHQIAIPIGIGLRYKLSKQWDANFEIGWRLTGTDYLDDVSSYYVKKEDLYEAHGGGDKGWIAVQLSDRSVEYFGDPAFDALDNNGSYPYVIDGQTYYGTRGWGSAYGKDQRGDLRRKSDQTGKQGRKDAYIVTGFQLNYIIPGRVVCPKFR